MQAEIQQVSTFSQFSKIILGNVKCRATFIMKISFNIYFLHYELLMKILGEKRLKMRDKNEIYKHNGGLPEILPESYI